jgi:hypothetical protein
MNPIFSPRAEDVGLNAQPRTGLLAMIEKTPKTWTEDERLKIAQLFREEAETLQRLKEADATLRLLDNLPAAHVEVGKNGQERLNFPPSFLNFGFLP